jgi:hypothetical protein
MAQTVKLKLLFYLEGKSMSDENVVELNRMAWPDAVDTVELALTDYMLLNKKDVTVRDAKELTRAWQRILTG